MTAVISTHCRECGTPLRNKFSRTIGLGTECRKDMTPEQLVDAIRANQPGYIPKATPPSAQARRNHAEIARATTPTPNAKRCVHEAIPASCALCRRDRDPWRAAERVITLVQRLPMTERLDTQRKAARSLWAAYLPEPEPHQLTIGATQ